MSAVMYQPGQPIPMLCRRAVRPTRAPRCRRVPEQDLTRSRPALRSLEPILRARMAGAGWVTYHELAAALQVPVQGVRRALERMVAAGAVERVIRGRYECGAGQLPTLFRLIETGNE